MVAMSSTGWREGLLSFHFTMLPFQGHFQVLEILEHRVAIATLLVIFDFQNFFITRISSGIKISLLNLHV